MTSGTPSNSSVTCGSKRLADSRAQTSIRAMTAGAPVAASRPRSTSTSSCSPMLRKASSRRAEKAASLRCLASISSTR